MPLLGSFSEIQEGGRVEGLTQKYQMCYNSITASTEREEKRETLPGVSFFRLLVAPTPAAAYYVSWINTSGLVLRMSSLKWALRDPVDFKPAAWSSRLIWSARVIYYELETNGAKFLLQQSYLPPKISHQIFLLPLQSFIQILTESEKSKRKWGVGWGWGGWCWCCLLLGCVVVSSRWWFWRHTAAGGGTMMNLCKQSALVREELLLWSVGISQVMIGMCSLACGSAMFSAARLALDHIVTRFLINPKREPSLWALIIIIIITIYLSFPLDSSVFVNRWDLQVCTASCNVERWVFFSEHCLK